MHLTHSLRLRLPAIPSLPASPPCPPQHLDRHSKDIIKKLLTADLTKRIGNLKAGADDIKKHKWCVLLCLLRIVLLWFYG